MSLNDEITSLLINCFQVHVNGRSSDLVYFEYQILLSIQECCSVLSSEYFNITCLNVVKYCPVSYSDMLVYCKMSSYFT